MAGGGGGQGIYGGGANQFGGGVGGFGGGMGGYRTASPFRSAGMPVMRQPVFGTPVPKYGMGGSGYRDVGMPVMRQPVFDVPTPAYGLPPSMEEQLPSSVSSAPFIQGVGTPVMRQPVFDVPTPKYGLPPRMMDDEAMLYASGATPPAPPTTPPAPPTTPPAPPTTPPAPPTTPPAPPSTAPQSSVMDVIRGMNLGTSGAPQPPAGPTVAELMRRERQQMAREQPFGSLEGKGVSPTNVYGKGPAGSPVTYSNYNFGTLDPFSRPTSPQDAYNQTVAMGQSQQYRDIYNAMPAHIRAGYMAKPADSPNDPDWAYAGQQARSNYETHGPGGGFRTGGIASLRQKKRIVKTRKQGIAGLMK